MRTRSTISLKRSTQNLQRSTRRPADYPICYPDSGHSADGLTGLNLNSEPGTQRFQGQKLQLTPPPWSAYRSVGLSLPARFRPIVGDVKRYGTYRHGYLRYGMINLGNCHAKAQRATAKFKIY